MPLLYDAHMSSRESPASISLHNFEGPVEFLLYLIQKSEIAICDVSLHAILSQYLEQQLKRGVSLDGGAEFLGTVSSLILLKSRSLLPQREQGEQLPEEVDPRFEIIHQLMDYCRFKEAGRLLAEREEKQAVFFERGMDQIPFPRKMLGIEHLTLQDLASLFQHVLIKATPHKGTIHEEVWQVGDKIASIRELLFQRKRIAFFELFSIELCREELIVIFLALLELMKLGTLSVFKQAEEVFIAIREKESDDTRN
jgi:segregation and condensation protein A